jgi:hypothetical protein
MKATELAKFFCSTKPSTRNPNKQDDSMSSKTTKFRKETRQQDAVKEIKKTRISFGITPICEFLLRLNDLNFL